MRNSWIHTLAILATAVLVGCSKSQIPASARVQDLGTIRVNAKAPTRVPLAGEKSLYCVAGRPEQLPEKIEVTLTLKTAPDGSTRITLDNTPTPANYGRLWLRHLEVPFKAGVVYEARAGEFLWIRFTPVLDSI